MFSDIKRTKSRSFWQQRCVVRIKKNDMMNLMMQQTQMEQITSPLKGGARRETIIL